MSERVVPARRGVWASLDAELRAQDSPGDGEGVDVWGRVSELVDIAEFRPKLADDVEVKEFSLRWGNDYVMIANPRDLLHYQLEPNQARQLALMDGTRTVKEILVETLEESGELELSGIADLVLQLYVGNFLDRPYVDLEEALERAVHPVTERREKARRFASTLSIEWKKADRPIRWMYDHGLKYVFNPVASVVSAAVVVAGLVAFVAVVRESRYSLNDVKSLALGFLFLTILNYFLTFVHELGHAIVLVHYGRRVKSAGFMIYFGAPAFFVESADGLMLERGQRIMQAFVGGYFELIFCGAASLALWLAPGTVLAPVLYRFAVLGYLTIFFNFIPLLELDGYFMLTDFIQVPDLRPRSLSFIRHDAWHKLRTRQRFTSQEIGLGAYAIVGVAFTILSLYLGFYFWLDIFGSLLSRLWRGGVVSRLVLIVLVLVVAGPLVRGAITLLRAIGRRLRALWEATRFRLERSWRVEAAQLIDALPLFDDVPEDVLNDLAGRVRLRGVARGAAVVRQGERAEAFYLVRRGTFQVVEENPDTGAERVLRVLGRGEAFGETALVRAAPRAATVRALEESQVFEIGKGTFDQLLRDMVHVPEFAPTMQAVAELRELPPFASLEPDELSDLLRHGDWVTFAPGEVIIHQGDVGDAFYAIRSGQAEVSRDGERIATMGPGTHVGEIALLSNVPRTATVTASTPLRAYRLDREGFDRLVRRAFRSGTLNPAISPDTVWQH
jgi:putative peptide zinc metalloprotease protein